MKVKELLKYLKEEVTQGNGDDLIIMSSDPEGNSYHKLTEYSFGKGYTDFEDLHRHDIDIFGEEDVEERGDKAEFEAGLKSGKYLKCLVLYP